MGSPASQLEIAAVESTESTESKPETVSELSTDAAQPPNDRDGPKEAVGAQPQESPPVDVDGDASAVEDKTQSEDTVTEANVNHKQPAEKPVVVHGVSGVVKWFNIKRGYGFVHREDIGVDIFVHGSAISAPNPRIWLRTLKESERVTFNVVQGAKGLEAASVTGFGGRPVRGADYYDIYRATGALPDHWHGRVRTGQPIFVPAVGHPAPYRRQYPAPPYVQSQLPYRRQPVYGHPGYGGYGSNYYGRPVPLPAVGTGGYTHGAPRFTRRLNYYGRSTQRPMRTDGGGGLSGDGVFKSRPLHASQEKLVRKLRGEDQGTDQGSIANANPECDDKAAKTKPDGGSKRSARVRPRQRHRRREDKHVAGEDKGKADGEEKQEPKSEGSSSREQRARPSRRRSGSHDLVSKSLASGKKEPHRRRRSTSRSRKTAKPSAGGGGGDADNAPPAVIEPTASQRTDRDAPAAVESA